MAVWIWHIRRAETKVSQMFAAYALPLNLYLINVEASRHEIRIISLMQILILRLIKNPFWSMKRQNR